jgi:MORN repeat
VFRRRSARDRALLCSACVASDVSVLALAGCACIWGIAGAEIAAVVACVSFLSQHLIARALDASAKTAVPPALRHADGGVYDGEWAGAEKAGLGVYKYPSGARFEGRWSANVKHGWGVYHYPDGGKFEGGFAGGQRSGLGVRSWPSGESKVCSSRKCIRCLLPHHTNVLDCRCAALSPLPCVRASEVDYVTYSCRFCCRQRTLAMASSKSMLSCLRLGPSCKRVPRLLLLHNMQLQAMWQTRSRCAMQSLSRRL